MPSVNRGLSIANGRLTVAHVGRVEVSGDELGEVALAIARAGMSRLMTELGLAVAAA